MPKGSPTAAGKNSSGFAVRKCYDCSQLCQLLRYIYICVYSYIYSLALPSHVSVMYVIVILELFRIFLICANFSALVLHS